MRNQFNVFVRRLCKKKNKEVAAMKGYSKKDFFEEKLCEGLCSTKTLRNLQNGSRKLDNLLQDEILSRLGIAMEDYNYLLDYNEYSRWKARQQILHNITWKKTDVARQLLKEYQKCYDMENRLERQFVLSMRAQIQYLQGANKNKLSVLFEEALNLTIPSLAEKKLEDLVLSIRELNLILEAENCREDDERPEQYIEILNYLEKSGWDKRNMAKLYPKAVYYLCGSVMGRNCLKKDSQWSSAELLRYCNRGIELLRDNERMYFLWELLRVRAILLDVMQQELSSQGKWKRADSLQAMCQENREYLQVLEKTYTEFHVPKETFHYCYLYVVSGVSCVNDVIRCRRKMLGMTRKELYENICSEKTLGRLERCETSAQKEIKLMLLERLGLSQEVIRTELVTDSPEAIQLMEKLRYHTDRQKWVEVDMLRKEIENLVDMDIINNRQVLKRCEIVSLWEQGKLEKEEYWKRMKEILEMTMPFEVFLKEGEKYLTYEEQFCIQNLMEIMDRNSDEYTICLQRFEEMYRPYIDSELQDAVFGMYEYIMGYVGSEYRNKGDLYRADLYSETICQGGLWLRMMSGLSYNLYDCWWRDMEQKYKSIPAKYNLDGVEELARCIVISRLNKKEHRECFYRKVLKTLEQEE